MRKLLLCSLLFLIPAINYADMPIGGSWDYVAKSPTADQFVFWTNDQQKAQKLTSKFGGNLTRHKDQNGNDSFEVRVDVHKQK